MVGQEKLLAKLNSYSINTLPKAILFIGEEGCGKHTVAKILAANLYLPVVEPTNIITIDDIIAYSQDPIAKLYIINLDNYLDKQQNQLLKFIEEPGKNIHIILTASSEISVLPTILNRCIKMYFEPYTLEQLKKIKLFSNELVYKVCKTPGQLVSANESAILELYKICKAMPKVITKANYANLLTLETKLNYKDQYDKPDFILFFNMMTYATAENYLDTNDQASLKVYNFTNNFKQKMVNKVIVKENFMINYLTTLWEVMQNDPQRA